MPAVTGIEAFREAMAGHEDDYVLIGGGACSILFDLEAIPFRATKDLDIVVLTDSGADGFARALWSFVRRNGYNSLCRAEGDCSYFRFILPKDMPNIDRLPEQIELFARHPNFKLNNEESEIAPLPFDEDVSSLLDIILEDGYYEFIKRNVRIVDGVPLLTALHIIPLKMHTHIDLNRGHRAGQHVNGNDLVKHRGESPSSRAYSHPQTVCRSGERCKRMRKSFSSTFRTTQYARQTGWYRQDSCALSDSPIGPPSGAATPPAASRPGSGATPTRSPRRTSAVR